MKGEIIVKEHLSLLKSFMHDYILSDDQMQMVYDRFLEQIKKGLTRDTHDEAETKCYMTYVQDLPTGEELGRYLALDLGGSKFRVILVHLKGKYEPELYSKDYNLPARIITGPGKYLFDHIAMSLADFVEEFNVENEVLPLGVTFAFPCVQTGLSKAVLVRWTKGFTCADVENEEIGRMLIEAIKRQANLRIHLVAIINDTTGTYMSCAIKHTDCRIGLIIDDGTNACYVERTENCEMLGDEYKKKPFIVVNIEWGAFGDRGELDFVRTYEDLQIDAKSNNRGRQVFEKIVSGMYIGNVVRLVLRKAVRENLIFSACCAMANRVANVLINNPLSVELHHIADVLADKGPEYADVRRVLKEVFNMELVTIHDLEKFRFICETVSKRSAYLVGVCLSALVNRMEIDHVVVGVDGKVYRTHPAYADYMREIMDRFTNKYIKYELAVSDDGAGRGAALVAAVAMANK